MCCSFLSFGVGLDPRQHQVFGPKLGPFLTACVLGLVSFSSVGLATGYPGAGLNPARCFSTAVARGEFKRKILFSFCVFNLRYVLTYVWQINGYGGLGLSRAELHRVSCIILPRHITERIAKRHRVYRLHSMHSKYSVRVLYTSRGMRACITSALAMGFPAGTACQGVTNSKVLPGHYPIIHVGLHRSNMLVSLPPLVSETQVYLRPFSTIHLDPWGRKFSMTNDPSAAPRSSRTVSR